MKTALKKAKIALKNDDIPVGAVIVCNNKIIATGYNQVVLKCDPTAHSEVLAIKRAAKIKKNYNLNDCEIYVNLEPCTMCLAVISLAKISKIYYGVANKKFGAIESNANFFKNNKNYYHPEIYSGIMEEESLLLMQEFFSSKRSVNNNI
jgi:tRNA(adenine34) deaminase